MEGEVCMKSKGEIVILFLFTVIVLLSGCGSGRKALQAENNSYFTQEIYDNLKEMRFYFGGSEPAEVVNDEERMYEIFNFLASLAQCDTGNEEQLWGFNIFEFVMDNGDVHRYAESGKNMTHWLNYIYETEDNYEEAGPINKKKEEHFYIEQSIGTELDELVYGSGK